MEKSCLRSLHIFTVFKSKLIRYENDGCNKLINNKLSLNKTYTNSFHQNLTYPQYDESFYKCLTET